MTAPRRRIKFQDEANFDVYGLTDSADALSHALERAGQLPQEAALLEKVLTIQLPAESITDDEVFHARLVRIYSKLGQPDAAQRHERELHRMLSLADPDHPLLADLNRNFN